MIRFREGVLEENFLVVPLVFEKTQTFRISWDVGPVRVTGSGRGGWGLMKGPFIKAFFQHQLLTETGVTIESKDMAGISS